MERLLKYSILTVLIILAYSTVIHTHTNLRMCDAVSNQTTIQNSADQKRVSDIIHYLHSNTQKVTVDNDKQYKCKPHCQILYHNSKQAYAFKSQISIKNQHTHFETDYPIAYYIYALNRIVI